MTTLIQERDFLFSTIQDIEKYATRIDFSEIPASRAIPELKAKFAFTNTTRQRFLVLHHDISKKKLDDDQRQAEEILLQNFLRMCNVIDMKINEVMYQYQYQEAAEQKQKPELSAAEGNSTLAQILETVLEKQTKNIQDIVGAHKLEIETMSNVLEKQTAIKHKRYKLPPLEIPKFSGKLTEWTKFRDLYMSNIHNRDDLEPVEKFQYLASYLTGEAASYIKNIPATDANYHDAWERLVRSYNKPKNIAFDHIRAYIEQSKKAVSNPEELKTLFVTIEETVRALDALNATGRDPWLIYLAMEAFDSETRNQWSREPISGVIPTFDEFTEFIEKRYDSWISCWEKKQESKSAKPIPGKQSKPPGFKGFGSQQNQKTIPGSSSLVSTTGQGTMQCFICSGNDHHVAKCQKFLTSEPSRRVELIRTAALCFNCLRPGHRLSECRGGTCRQCQMKHNTLIHEAFAQKPRDHVTQKQSETDKQPEETQQSATQRNLPTGTSSTGLVNHTVMASQSSTLSLLPSIQILVKDREGKQHQCRALLDSCSQSNMITRSMAVLLNLPVRVSTIGAVKGIGAMSAGTPQELTADISSRDNAVSMKLDFLVLDHITDDQPVSTANVTHQIPTNVFLADPEFYKPRRIDMLLGADVFMKILRSRQIPGSPTFQETAFGYVAAGVYGTKGPLEIANSFISTCSCSGDQLKSLNEQFEKFVKAEELQKSQGVLTAEENRCEEHFVLNTTRTETGRFVCGIPTTDDLHTLGESKEQAMKQFLCGERQRLRKPELNKQYVEFMQNYRESNHMRLQPPGYQSSKPEVFLPHHPVFKESSTTPVRVVFNASKKTSSGKSLNDVLMVGPKVQDDIFDIMIRSREDRILVKADLKQMFRHIDIRDEDQSLQKIFWRDTPSEPVQIYLLRTVTYGTACAPFLAARCIKQLSIDGKQQFPLAASVVEKDTYMDDVITSIGSIQEAIELQKQLDGLFKSGGFFLRKWCSNAPEVLEGIPEEDREIKGSLDMDFEGSVKTLGIAWNPATDLYSYEATEFNSLVTKRNILSDTARIYDPLGLLAPLTVTAKILFQSLWKLKADWDTELNENIQAQWKQYQENVVNVTTQMTIPRQISDSLFVMTQVQLIGFSDASEKAIAACVYARTIDSDGRVSSRLYAAKTKVSPVSKITIARLELCAAALLAKLIRRVKDAMKREVTEIHAFSDSTIVLCWIAKDPSHWKTFVSNRVSYIQNNIPTAKWHHVISQENPADLASRGVSADELVHSSLWWTGPPWMTEDEMTLRSANEDVAGAEAEIRKSITLVSTADFWEFIYRYSSYTKIIRYVALWKRYMHNLQAKKKKTDPITGCLTPVELETAACSVLRHVQQQMFTEDYDTLERKVETSEKSRFFRLNPFLDNNGLIRVGGRIRRAHIQYDQKHPILLPQNHHITRLIAEEAHQETLHGGTQLMLTHIRQKFWPIRGIDLCKRTVKKCVTCFRVKPKATEHYMSDCHSARVNAVHPFYQTGIDYCGPVYIKTPVRSRVVLKMYIALFTCLATRAIHLELVTDLTTQAFIAALKRFMSRRGKPNEILCDNAMTFVGADREIRQMSELMSSEEHQTRVIDSAAREGITFKFIPPRSPHFGGAWESLIKRVKFHLYRAAGDSHLTQEEMLTLLAQIEACVNSRPLTTISSDPADLEPLTPAHFLIGRAFTSLPEPNLTNVSEGRLKHWKSVQQRVQFFWHRWSTEYLHTLQQRHKWTSHYPAVKIGDIVIIMEDNLPPLKWKMGRVILTHPGADGTVRVVTVQTRTGTYRRAVAKLCVLPIESPETPSGVSARPGNGTT
ncbi:uncharacterized protein LOC129805799 [Phlebotomus papatasi]|uniref:uncharacterized protein LOC129805799 n=1 Tax=Phlebotomus papatasi TaxID=29031 RepID=UPI002483814E|nr:uncharacterized protein LOC129805799 [Phlebotomus papatasi]XP_055709930.1 uncharacterized protein LOC129805799 [Phlebotomus papatasi]